MLADLLDLRKPSQYLVELAIDDETSNILSATNQSSTHLVWQNLRNKSQIFQQGKEKLC